MTEPTELQKAMAAAEQREQSVGGAGASFEAKRPKIVGGNQAQAQAPQEPAIPDFVSERAHRISRLRARVLTIASMAREEGNHPRHSFPPDVATMIWTMADMSMMIMDAKPIALPSAVTQTSAPEDMKRAQDVADALSGGAAA